MIIFTVLLLNIFGFVYPAVMLAYYKIKSHGKMTAAQIFQII
jgi:hypothetical protein